MKTVRTVPAKLALLLGIVVIFSTLFIGSSLASVDSDQTALGAYSCCGDATCAILVPTRACPNGTDDQCPGKINEVKAKCCVNRCNDPHAADPDQPAPGDEEDGPP